VIGLSRNPEEVSFSLICEGVRPKHCHIQYHPQHKQYTIRDLTEGRSGTWMKLRNDNRGIEISSASALECNRVIHEPIFDENNPMDHNLSGFKDFPTSLISLRQSKTGGTQQILGKENSGELWIRLGQTDQTLFPGDQIRIGQGGPIFEVRRFCSGSGSAQGIRPTMEDEDIMIDDLPILHLPDLRISWFGCYDGHGSFECSNFVKKHLHRNFLHSMSASSNVSVDTIKNAFINAFKETDNEFEKFANQRGISQNVGSVVIVVAIINDFLFCANLGDARAVLSSGGNTIDLSRDMKPNVPEETERIKKFGGQVINNRVNGRLAVSRAIGDFEFKSAGLVSNVPEIRMIRRDQVNDEFIVMACDGLYDVMSSNEVVEFVRDRIRRNPEAADPNQIAVDLVTESIMKRNTSDNVTVMIILLKKY